MSNKLLTALVLGAGIISSSGCGTQTRTVFIQEPLPIPDRPALPRIQGEDLLCIPDDAYVLLVERDALQAAHIERLEAILRSTH